MKVEPAVGTQNRIVLDILRMRPICAGEIYRPGSPITHRLAARVGDLRHRFGWDIETERCRLHPHDAPVALYRLVESDQMEFHLG